MCSAPTSVLLFDNWEIYSDVGSNATLKPMIKTGYISLMWASDFDPSEYRFTEWMNISVLFVEVDKKWIPVQQKHSSSEISNFKYSISVSDPRDNAAPK